MAVTWRPAADKHGIPREEALWAMLHPHHIRAGFGKPRPGHSIPPTLYIGPSRMGTLEVLAEVTPPDRVVVFHVMLLRASTAQEVGYEGEGT